MEKFSSINRVVGAAPEERKKAIVKEKELYFKEQPFPYLKSQERMKTPEEVEIISLANEAIDTMKERLGLDAFEIPPNNIHVVPEEVWVKIGEKGAAFYNSGKQTIIMREQSSKLAFVRMIVHEMLHFKSYNALQVTTEGKVGHYRSGLKVHSRDGKKLYFESLDEAVIEELTKRLVAELKQESIFQEDVKKTRETIKRYSEARSASGTPLFDEDTFNAEVEEKKSWGASLGRLFGLSGTQKINTNRFVYPQEREMLSILMDKIRERNTGKFKDTEEVFEMFVKGVMTGNILEIGKIIDSTFGVGTFRSIGEKEKSIQAKIDFVKSL